jgi:CRISPR/Cas system CSM-associated protein Csm3 (group 7 of RAMP superfamily)
LLHSHAEDEFSGGAYGSAKYDRLALLNAQFSSRMVIECRESELANLTALFKKVCRLAELGLTPVGGATRRGFGQGIWSIKEHEIYGGSANV